MSSGRPDSDHDRSVCLLLAGSLPVDLTDALVARAFAVREEPLSVSSASGGETEHSVSLSLSDPDPPDAVVLVTNDPAVLADTPLGTFGPVVVATSDRDVERAVHTGEYPVAGVCRVTDDSSAATLAWVVDSSIEVHEYEVRTERLLTDTALIREVNTAIVRATSQAEIEQTVCERLVETRYSLAWVASEADGAFGVRALAGDDGATDGASLPTDAVPLADEASGDGPLAAALESNEIQVAWDVDLDPRFEPDGADGPFGVAVAPLVYEDRCFGLLVVHSPSREDIDEQARELLTDIVENAAHAIQAARDRETVRLSRNRLEAITGAIPDLVIVYDENGRYEEVLTNEPVLGLEEPEILLGRTAHELLPHPTADTVLQAVRDTIATGESQTIEYTVPFEGETFVWEARTTLLERDDDGGRVVFLARDVTERHEYQAELEAKNERLDEFASFVSHDLRNPLNVAQATLGMVEPADDDSATHLDEAEEALDRMTALIEDVLALARQGAVVESPTETPLEPVVHRAWAAVDSGNATLDVDPDLGIVMADPDRLQQLFENLFRNAVEHGSSDGGDHATVHVSRTPEGFRVVDDGPGIPVEDRERVLEHGFTTADSGTGFGLAIVDRIAAAHGWSMAVVDPPEPDLGACFEVRGVEFA